MKMDYIETCQHVARLWENYLEDGVMSRKVYRIFEIDCECYEVKVEGVIEFF